MATMMLPKFVVLKSHAYPDKGNAYYKEGGSVLVGEASVFSTLVKIETERGTSEETSKYVSLRFCSSNKYWQKNATDNSIVAVSNKPDEDTTKSSCTLFEAVEVDSDNGLFYLTHVQSGGRLLIHSSTMGFYIEANPNDDQGYLSFIDWDTLVKLPEHVAFKGDNAKYLQAFYDDHNYLKFKGEDPIDVLSGHKVTLMADGHVRITSDHWAAFWRRSSNWIWADVPDTLADLLPSSTLDVSFWPVKIDDTTIALRSAGNNKFCQRLTTDGMESCLNAAASSLVKEARLTVEELVSNRKIYNVRYRMEDARIYGETPYLAGTASATNESDQEGSISVEVGYENESSYSFSNSVSITAGVTNSITAGIPEIAEETIEISYQIETSMEWNTTTTSKTSVKATGSVPVPPRSVASVSYVGTRGTCDVPFSYTQQDTSSTDGKIIETEHIDGVYKGVNLYNFSFVVEKILPLG